MPPARWLWLGGYLLAAVILFFCYLRISGTQAVTSDGASNALQAWNMLHGNWLLKGWSLTDVSFYTTELPEYILVEIFRGLGPSDVHVSAAITYTLLVILAGLLAKNGKTGRAGLIRVLIASGIMIAPQVGAGAFLLLLSPDHTGTGVPLLLIFLVLDRAPRRPWTVVLLGLMLAWGQVGDKLVLTIGVLPIVAVCAIRAYQGVVVRREPLRDRAFELQLAVAALASVVVADLAVKLVRSLGGYSTAPLDTVFASSALWPAHFALAAEGLLGIYGADFTGTRLGVTAGFEVLHLAGLALAVWALGRVIRRFFMRRQAAGVRPRLLAGLGAPGDARGEGVRFRPPAARRELLRDDEAGRPRLLHSARTDNRRLRQARPNVALRGVDGHGVEQEPAHRSRPLTRVSAVFAGSPRGPRSSPVPG